MENLAQLPDETILKTTQDLVAKERELTLEILHFLREVERRQLFARMGFSSLFEFAVKELKYSEGAAHRRISSMRLLKALPEIESKIESGTLLLSTLSQAQSFFRQEKITAPAAKMELLEKLEGRSAREVERVLVSESSDPDLRCRESLRAVAKNVHHLSLTIDGDLVEKIEELKALLSHRSPNMRLRELVTFAIEECLTTHRMKKPKVKTSKEAAPPNEVSSQESPNDLDTMRAAIF